jgi:hypothetical protein
MSKLGICLKCGLEKENIVKGLCIKCYKNKRYRSGKDKKSVDKYRKLNIEKISKYRDKWRLENKSKERGYLLKRYNMTLNDYNRLLMEQDEKCKICGKYYDNRPLNIDHCHVTGRVRGLVCCRCNILIGFMENCKNIIPLVEKYLNENSN